MSHFVYFIFGLGSLMVVVGLCTLTVLIPWIGTRMAKTTIRTEFFSARAAYWCVIGGLGILVAMSAGVAVRFVLTSKMGGVLMSFLAYQEIWDKRCDLFPVEFNEKQLHQSSYDLSLGEEIYIVGQSAPQHLTADAPYAMLPPGQFAILTSKETVHVLKGMMAFISVRSKFKFEGLVNISGFHVDPSFKGKLRFGVQNVGPTDIHLKFDEPTFTIFFANLTSENIGKTRDDQDDIHFGQNLKGIRLEDVQLLGGDSVTLSSLQKEVDRLRTLVMIYGPVAISALLALIFKLIK